MSEPMPASRLLHRPRQTKQRLILLGIAVAILLLAAYGWVVQALRVARCSDETERTAVPRYVRWRPSSH